MKICGIFCAMDEVKFASLKRLRAKKCDMVQKTACNAQFILFWVYKIIHNDKMHLGHSNAALIKETTVISRKKLMIYNMKIFSGVWKGKNQDFWQKCLEISQKSGKQSKYSKIRKIRKISPRLTPGLERILVILSFMISSFTSTFHNPHA